MFIHNLNRESPGMQELAGGFVSSRNLRHSEGDGLFECFISTITRFVITKYAYAIQLIEPHRISQQ